MTHKIALAAATAVSFSFTPLAASAELADPIEVTATRSAQTIDETIASVSIITRQDIERIQPQTVIDLLGQEVGVDVIRNGGPGGTTNIFLRGTNSNHTLVLIDGVRAASATSGAFSWQNLAVSDIERIEIVRGPRASHYGSEAIGGVIQIFTRRNEGRHVRAEAGSFGTREVEAGFGVGDKTRFSLNVAYQDIEGFSATNAINSSYNADTDGVRKNSVTARLSSQLSEDTTLSVDAWHNNGETEFDQGVIESINDTANVTLDQHLTGAWSHKLTGGYNYEELETNSSFPSTIKTKRHSLDWQHNIDISATSMLTAGISRHVDEAENVNDSTNSIVFDERITNDAAFASLQSDIDAHRLMISLRMDDHSSFGDYTTGQVGWGYDLNPQTRLVASYGTAFRAPSANELFHPGFGGFYAGNPDLEPEESEGGDVGVRYAISDKQKLSATYFHNDIENLIAYEGTNFQAVNVDEARSYGLEVEYDVQMGEWTASAKATIQKAYDKADKSDLIRRPRRKLNLALVRRLQNDGSVRIEWLGRSQRLDGSNKDVELGSYAVLNVASRVSVGDDIWMESRVENLFDKQYQLVNGYNTPDLGVYVGVHARL